MDRFFAQVPQQRLDNGTMLTSLAAYFFITKAKLFTGFASLAVVLSVPVIAQETRPPQDELSGFVDDPQEEQVRGRELERVVNVVPLTSRFLLNGTTLEYGVNGVGQIGALGGDERNPVPYVDFTYAFTSDIQEDIEVDTDTGGIVFARTQNGWYGQLRTVDRKRTITTDFREAGRIVGFRNRLSVTGRCIFDGNPDDYCTYTPGVSFDDSSIDPDLLIPTRYFIDSSFGERIDKETHEALKAQGWQRGTGQPGDDIVGVDVDVPSAGFLPLTERATTGDIDRREETRRRLIFSLSKAEQNLYSNTSSAALDRTTRGLVLLDPEEWTTEAAVAQIAAWFLPGYDGQLVGEAGVPNLNVPNTLFQSANNVWRPEDSFAVFETGRGQVSHASNPVTRAADIPGSWYNSFWMGFSPVQDIEVTSRLSYRTTEPRETTQSVFRQGGFGTPFDGLISGGVTLIDEIDNQLTQIEFSNIDDLFVQAGVDFTTQEAVQTITEEETSHYRYVPHLSFSGNRTDGRSVARYYAGLILDGDANAYVGGDYTVNTENGWNAYARLDLYSDPDRDYYSEAEGRLSRDIRLSRQGHVLTLGVAGTLEIDRPNLNGSQPRVGEGASRFDFVSRYRTGDLDYTFRQRFNNLNNDGGTSSSTFGLNYRVTPQISLAGQVTPISDEGSFVRARFGGAWRLVNSERSPILRAHWAQIDYNYGRNNTSNRVKIDEQVFQISIQARF